MKIYIVILLSILTLSSKAQTYYEFDSKMLIDKELIALAEEFDSDFYKKYNFFYGVVSYLTKILIHLKLRF